MFKHIALATAAFGMLSSPVLADENAQMTRGEEKLAKLLDGRVAGEPQSCIRTLGSRNLSQIDGTALTYRDGDTVWVNYTRNPDSIDDRDIMIEPVPYRSGEAGRSGQWLSVGNPAARRVRPLQKGRNRRLIARSGRG